MDILEAGEKCKVIIVRENSDEIIAVSLPYVDSNIDFPRIGFEKGTTERGFSKVSKSV